MAQETGFKPTENGIIIVCGVDGQKQEIHLEVADGGLEIEIHESDGSTERGRLNIRDLGPTRLERNGRFENAESE